MSKSVYYVKQHRYRFSKTGKPLNIFKTKRLKQKLEIPHISYAIEGVINYIKKFDSLNHLKPIGY